MKKWIPNYRRLRIRQQLQVKLLNFIIAMVIFILLDYIIRDNYRAWESWAVQNYQSIVKQKASPVSVEEEKPWYLRPIPKEKWWSEPMLKPPGEPPILVYPLAYNSVANGTMWTILKA